MPAIMGCHSGANTLDSLNHDFWEYCLDPRNGDRRLKNDKRHHPRSLDDVAISIFHSSLLGGITLTTFTTLVSRIQDSNAILREQASVPSFCVAELV